VMCPICGTVQSRAMFRQFSKLTEEEISGQLGFSCIGRQCDAGPFKPDVEPDSERPGCDWTLGGLFQLHKLEVEYPDGKVSPAFEPASPEQALTLKAKLGERQIS